MDALEEYKQRVGAVAMRYAVTYDWCKQVAQALKELDIDMPEPVVHARVTVIYEVTATVPFDDLVSFNADPKAFVAKHLHVPSLLVESATGAINVEGGLVDPVSVRVDDAYTPEAP